MLIINAEISDEFNFLPNSISGIAGIKRLKKLDNINKYILNYVSQYSRPALLSLFVSELTHYKKKHVLEKG